MYAFDFLSCAVKLALKDTLMLLQQLYLPHKVAGGKMKSECMRLFLFHLPLPTTANKNSLSTQAKVQCRRAVCQECLVVVGGMRDAPDTFNLASFDTLI